MKIKFDFALVSRFICSCDISAISVIQLENLSEDALIAKSVIKNKSNFILGIIYLTVKI